MKLINTLKKNKILVLVIVLVLFVMMNKKEKTRGRSKGKWTVYGTDWCGYTKKQLKHMDDNTIEYDYIECSDGACDGLSIEAFPTLRDPSGKLHDAGFKEV